MKWITAEKRWINLILVYGLGETPMMLASNIAIRSKEDFEEFEEDYDKEMDMSEMEDNAEDVIDEASALLNEITIELKGLPEHYKVDMDMSSCAVITNEIVKAIVEMIEELLSWIYPDMNMEESGGFKEIINLLLEEEDTSIDELIAEIETEAPELAEQVRVLFDEIDHVLEYMQSDEFPGLLFVGASLSCDCPVKGYYEIHHEYYKNVNGKLVFVDSMYEDFEDFEGETVSAKDYIKCEYNGVKYKYMGSFRRIQSAIYEILFISDMILRQV